MLCAGVCAVVVPLLLFTLATAGALAVAVVTDGDLGGPLFYPAGALVIVLAGSATFVLVSLLGVSADLLRRWLRWPLWSPLAAAGVACALGVVLARVFSHFDPRGALVFGALGFAAFASYWLPLALVLGAWGMLRRRVVSAPSRGA